MTRRQVTLSEEQMQRLRALSEHSRVPAAVFIREGIDRVLDLAEKQMDTLEHAQRTSWRLTPLTAPKPCGSSRER